MAGKLQPFNLDQKPGWRRGTPPAGKLPDFNLDGGRLPSFNLDHKPVAATVTKPHHGGGFLHGLKSLGHFVADKAERGGRDLKAIPGGTYDLVNTEQHVLRLTAMHPLTDPNDPKYGVNKSKWGRHLHHLLEGMKEGAITSVEHPLRDPVQTALTIAPFTHGLGKAADVASGGRITAADRGLTVGGEKVPLHASRNPAVKGVQLVHDKAVQRSIDRNPEGKVAAYGTKRVGGSLAETARYQGRLRETPAALLDQAAKRLTARTPTRAGTRVQQAALELTSVNTTPAKAAAYHLEQAAKGVAPARNRALAKLYRRVEEQKLLTTNKAGDVVVDAARHPKLAAADTRLSRVQGKGDEIIAKYGVATPEQLKTRVDRPAQVRAGASYEKPTPGKLGQSPAAEQGRRRVASLQRRFDQLAASEPAHGYHDLTRPRTEAEAQKLLAGLERKHGKFEQQVYDRLFPAKLTRDEMAQQRDINPVRGRYRRQQSGRGGASGFKVQHLPKNVHELRWQQVEAEIQRSLKAAGDHPSAKRLVAERETIDRLRSALETQPEEAFGGPRAPRTAEQLGTVTESAYKGPARPRLERLGGALSVAKDQLASLETQAANRVRQTGFGTARTRLEARVATHPEKLVADYERAHKNVVSTDLARELSPEYRASKQSRARLAADVHEPASAIAKLVYQAKLARRPARDRTVTFTGGGTGAGKTSGLELAGGVKRADIVYDTNLNNAASSVEKIDAALKSGRDVHVIYVYRHPVDALHGALHRAHRTGRTVPLSEHVKTHVGSNAAIRKLADHYQGNDRVKIEVVDNSLGKNKARPMPLDQLPTLRHNEVSHAVETAYQQELAAGRVAPHVHEGTAGDHRGVLREGAEQGRHAGPPDALNRRGRGFISYRAEEPRAPRGQVAASQGPVVGEARSPITSRTFTGHGIEQGLVPADVTGMASRHFHQIIRFVNTSEHRLQAIRTGSRTRTSSRDVLVRIPGEDHAKIPAAVNEILGKSKLTADDVDGLHAALQEFKADLVPGIRDRFATDRAQGIGTPAPDGYTWVDRNVLGDLAKPGQGPRGRVARSLDSVNSAVTAATVYFKIGHVGTRVLTNATTNILQGSARPVEIGRSVNLWHALGDEDRARALAAAGQHGFSAMPHEGVSLAARAAGHGARWWAKHADAPFRFNSIAYEARQAGFDTPAKFSHMLDQLAAGRQGMTSAEWSKLDGIPRRANREGIAYDRLSEAERRFVTRGIWFYPWIKGTVQFLGNTITEHPYKSGAIGALGQQGRANQQAELGDLPSYAGGLFKLGGSADRPTVADFSTFSPFATPADVLDDLARPAQLSDQLTPALSALTHLGFGLDQYGNATNQPISGALSTLVSPTPEAQILTAYLNRNEPQDRRMYPASKKLHGTMSPLLRALIGPGMPRQLNPTAAHSAAARERSGRR